LRQLAAFRCGLPEAKLLAELDYAFSDSEARQLVEDAERLSRGYPLAYLYGEVPFLGLTLKVDERGLIPRPETEFLTQQVIDQIHKDERKPKRILDMCCGTGAMGLALAQAFPLAEVWLSDLDEEALQLAKENAIYNQLGERCVFLKSDLWQEFIVSDSYDVIVANPPYIESGECLPESVTGFEPHMALFSEDQGMAHIKEILARLFNFLAPNGLAAFELSHRHHATLSTFIDASENADRFFWKDDPWQVTRFLWYLGMEI
jgi:release factor glutamine methyltransferase